MQSLYESYKEWMGAPDLVLTPDEGNHSKLPISILIHFPIEAEDVFETAFFTAGMSAQAMSEECPHAELTLEVLGRRSTEECQNMSRALAHIIHSRFEHGLYFKPNSVIRGIALPLFERMNCAFIGDWVKETPEWLPNTEPPVRILRVLPLFESEASAAEAAGEVNTIEAFARSGVSPADPSREPLGSFQ